MSNWLFYRIVIIAVITSCTLLYSMVTDNWIIARFGMLGLILASCFLGHLVVTREKSDRHEAKE